MTKHRVIPLTLGVLLVVGFPGPAAAVQTPPLLTISIAGTDGATGETIFEMEAAMDGTESPISISTVDDDGGLIDVASCTHQWGFRNRIEYTSSYVRHKLGSTFSAQSCGQTYRAAVHVALVKGGPTGEQVFSAYTDACANRVVANASAITCLSPRFSTKAGHRWYVASGHTYDIWNNGTRNGACDGCIDFTHVSK